MSDGFREWLAEAPDAIFGPIYVSAIGGIILIGVGLFLLRSPDRIAPMVLFTFGLALVSISLVRLILDF